MQSDPMQPSQLEDPIELEGEVGVAETGSENLEVVSPKPEYPWWQSMPVIVGLGAVVFFLGLYGIWAYTRPVDQQSNTDEVVASPQPSELPEPTQTPSPSMSASPFASPKPSGSPKPSVSPTPTPSPSPSPVQKANLYYDNVNCTYATGNGQPAQNLNNATFTSSNVPYSVLCSYLIQNSESTRTGDIVIRMTVDGKKVYEQTFAPLNKGNWPNSEFLGKSETVLLDPAVGLHTVTVEMNPDKTFPETNHNDNTFTARYSVKN